MAVLDWFRPPRYVLTLSLVVTRAGIFAMAWLGRELLDREQLAEKQRARASPFPEAIVAFTADRRSIRAHPPGAVVYFPVAGETSTDHLFRAAESLEYTGAAAKAIELYGELSRSSDSNIRAGALLRLGRVLRKTNRTDEALRVYSTLAALGATRAARLPAALLGREVRATVLAQKGAKALAANEARELCAELASGRWQIPRGAWFFLRQEGQSWLPAGSTCAPVVAVLSDAPSVSVYAVVGCDGPLLLPLRPPACCLIRRHRFVA